MSRAVRWGSRVVLGLGWVLLALQVGAEEASSRRPALRHSSFVPEGYTCAWSDEFGGARHGGQAAQALGRVWTPQLLHVNQEIQGYTRRQCDTHPENYNLCQRDGLMELRVRDEPINCGKADGSAFEVDELPGEPHDPECAEDWAFRGDDGTALRSYRVTSGRVMTKHALAFQYGYLEFAVLLPQHDQPQPESGLWPAVWTLGNDIAEGPCPGCYTDGTGVSWPACGEIDIMEYSSPGRHMGNNVLWLDDATGHVDACSAWPEHINGPGNPSCRGEDGGTAFAGWHDFPHDEWHTYALQWTATRLRFFIDGEERVSLEITDDNAAEFRNPHFLIANLAAGGVLGGSFEVTDFSEAALYVDYVRLYKDGTGSLRTPDGSGDCSIIGAPEEAATPSSGR